MIRKTYNKLIGSELFRHSAIYTLINFIEKALPFLVFPILTRKLSIEDVGLFVLYQTLIEILMPILTLSIDNSIILNYYKLELKEFKKYFSNAIFVFIVVFVFVFMIILFFNQQLSQLINFSSFWLNMVATMILFRFLTQLRQNIWRVQYDLKKYSKLTISVSFLGNFLGIFLVFYSDFGWSGMVIGHFVSYFLFGIYSLYTFLYESFITIQKLTVKYVKDILKISFPLALHRLGIWLGSAANKMIIAAILGTAATGSYGVGAVFASIITILEDSISRAIIPHVYEKLKINQAEEKKSIVKLSYMIYGGLLLISIFVYLIGYNLTEFIFGEQFDDTKYLLFPLIARSWC
jgi:O-antigen/teichoic acid export membrane protein